MNKNFDVLLISVSSLDDSRLQIFLYDYVFLMKLYTPWIFLIKLHDNCKVQRRLILFLRETFYYRVFHKYSNKHVVLANQNKIRA